MNDQQSTVSNEPPTASNQSAGALARLFREGHQFDFFQAARLLELTFTSSGSVEETLRFRPHSDLVFPATDVHSVERLSSGAAQARLTATFMGLYGIDSPLPVYFYQEIARESEHSAALRDFLDLFNNRLYALFYRSWKKYRPALHFVPGGGDDYSQRLLCLAGLGTKKTAGHPEIPPLRLAAFAGRLSCRVRNAEGLRHLIADFFTGIGVRIIENVPRWWRIPERPELRKEAKVRFVLGDVPGKMACIGAKIFDVAGKFRIVLGPLTLAQYLTFLPKGANASRLRYLVRLYAPDHLDFDVELILKTAEIPTVKLGDKSVQMGLTTWSGRPAGEFTSRVVAYEGGGLRAEG